MNSVEEKIAICFDGLRESPEPTGWVGGGPRSEDVSIYHDLPISGVDGGGVDVFDALEVVAQEELPPLITNEEEFNIASAFVLRNENTLKDAYEYTVTFSINL